MKIAITTFSLEQQKDMVQDENDYIFGNINYFLPSVFLFIYLFFFKEQLSRMISRRFSQIDNAKES